MDNNSNNNNRITEELKKEIQRLATEITSDNRGSNDDNNNINEAIKALDELKELYLKTEIASLSSLCDQSDVPDEFRCPISEKLMNDPVLLTSAKTYDRSSIENWLQDVLQTCPQTRQVLSHAVLAPNQEVRELIHQWCKDHVIQRSPPVNAVPDEAVRDRDHFAELLNKLSSLSLSEQKQAASDIRLLTKKTPYVRPYFGETPDAIQQLLDPLLQSENIDNNLRSDLVTALLNISIDKNIKQILSEHPRVITVLVESLIHGTIDTRSNAAAAALFALSSLDSNKILIGNACALKPLVDLLAEAGENSQAMQDAARAIYNLCVAAENRGRAVGAGAVRVILGKIKEGVFVEGLLSIMASLATHESGVEELVELGAVNCLLAIIRDGTSELNMENCIAILHSIYRKSRAVREEIRDEEKANGTISMVAEQGTSRARRKANEILDRFQRNTNTNLASTS